MTQDHLDPLDAILDIYPASETWADARTAIIDALLLLMTRFHLTDVQIEETMGLWRSSNCPGIKNLNKALLTEAIRVAKQKLPLHQIKVDIERHLQGETDIIPLPWPWLEFQTHAMRRGEVIIFAGPIKSGKSFMLLNIALEFERLGLKWKYLPLEDSKKDFGFRVMAVLENDYSMLDVRPETAHHRADCFVRREKQLEILLKNVEENPRSNGTNKRFPYQSLLSWVEEKTMESDIVFIDNLSQIDFDSKGQNYQEADLIRSLAIIAKKSKCIIVVCAHTIKRRGRDAEAPLCEGDLQGSAMLSRIAHTTMMLDCHKSKASKIMMEDGSDNYVLHRNTLYIPACRNGRGSRSSIAFSMGVKGPTFEEYGIIVSKNKAPKNRGDNE